MEVRSFFLVPGKDRYVNYMMKVRLEVGVPMQVPRSSLRVQEKRREQVQRTKEEDCDYINHSFLVFAVPPVLFVHKSKIVSNTTNNFSFHFLA